MNNGQTILLIDDEDNDAILIQRALMKAGIRGAFHRAKDGEDGIRYLKGETPYNNRANYALPTLVILDLKMPRKNGFEVLKWARGNKNTRRIPILVFTSSSERSDINKAYDYGANAYLVKPNSFECLTDLFKCVRDFWLTACTSPDFTDPEEKPAGKHRM